MAKSFVPIAGPETPDELFGKLSAGVPGILFCYWLSADGGQHCFPFVSAQIKDQFGIDRASLRASADPLFQRIHPQDFATIESSIIESATRLNPWRYQARLCLSDGNYRWFEAYSQPERQADGSTVWYGEFHDVQHYKDLESELRESEAEHAFQARFQNLIAHLSAEFINLGFEHIDLCIEELLSTIGEFFGVDRSYLYQFSDDYQWMYNRHEWCAPGVDRKLDSSRAISVTELPWWNRQVQSMIEQNRVMFVEDVDGLPVDAPDEKKLLQSQGVSSLFCVPIRIRGRVCGFFGVESLSRRSWRTDQEDLLMIVSGLLSGALERNRLEQELLNQSIRDPLTGLHNRRYLMPRLTEMLGRRNRYGESFALAMFDLDHFKDINDSLGHLGGDYILQRFAEELREQTRSTDVVARFGGEEFVVAFSAVRRPEEVRELVERILQSIASTAFAYNDSDVHLTASAGLACINELSSGPASPDALIDLADHRLYLAKKSGRNCLVDASGTLRI